ncbi:MAG: beta-phosphoglucomutase family hydrolase [Burkholderiales bacterium]|nr:beta-phosphoglucomutase family hydrolase [Burkholderiales bacterium]
MTSVPSCTLSPRDYDAVLFDLDGVLTRTASVHAAAWKKLFDEFLQERASATGEAFVPFDIYTDYHRHVDGKPRVEGVKAFIAARGITLPDEAVARLAEVKDRYFMQALDQQGVQTYESAVALVQALRAENVRTAVVSSSRNCRAVLEAAGIANLFDTRVDGMDLARLPLRGKPAPDSFLEAARRLDAEPARAVVVEDAIAGVAAGHAGGFGRVIGVDRSGQSAALHEAGADLVVGDLSQVRVTDDSPAGWSLLFDDFDPVHEGTREALCALGNGYFGTRGAAAGAVADGTHYPGTYLACGYSRLSTHVAGRVVEHEDLVNLPNWLALRLRIGDGDWFDVRSIKLLSYRQELDLRRGMLVRTARFEDARGRRTRLHERRLVSMSDRHLAAMEVALTAENWSAPVSVHSAIDARVVNGGAKLYREYSNRHLVPLGTEAVGSDGLSLLVRTSQSNLQVAQAARTRAFIGSTHVEPDRRLVEESGYVGQEFQVELSEGETLVLEKVVALHTSRDYAISEPALAAREAIARAGNFEAVLRAHVLAWKHLWRRFDVQLQPAQPGFDLNVLMLLRLHMFHLLQTVSPASIGLDIGVPARGWTGEAYKGHVFWDELFIFPFFNHRVPEITRALLMYRYRRLREARAAARAAGYRGAMFPWQSASSGREETEAFNLNPRSGRWVRDNTFLQRHVGSAVAYNVWQYFLVTRDMEFLHFYGAELILDIAQFWSSIARFDETRERYVIRGVMGPDEFHDAYPDAHLPGLNNNAYTNVMAVWVLCRALEVLDLLTLMRRAEIMTQLGLSAEDIERWRDISLRMYVPFHDTGIISQFEGYERLAELDWEHYRSRYGNIQRLELILEAENDSANRYKVSKQADVLMLFYLFSSEELGELFTRLGYPFESQTIPRNVAYYGSRSSHGSTLSRVVLAWVLARSDRRQSLKFFLEALQSDFGDIQQGTTAEGVHLGAMAGTVDLVERVWTGLELEGDMLRVNPQLPEQIERLDMRIRYRDHSFDLRLTHESLTVRERDGAAAPITLRVGDEVHELATGSARVFPLGGKAAG